MKSACLLPYSPLPVDSGARSIFNKHIQFLNAVGHCKILSSLNRPVGFGWTDQAITRLREEGVEVVLNERKAWSSLPRLFGMAYAAIFKAIKAERAFGHSNPYHRYAFDQDWLTQKVSGCDICEIHYTYWAYLETGCPKVVVVHDLWSDIMWEGDVRESRELESADLLVTISQTDKEKLESKGHTNVHWSPPCIDPIGVVDSKRIGIVGSGNRHNIEGMKWLLSGTEKVFPDTISCYGSLGSEVSNDRRFRVKLAYDDSMDPYRECGIILMVTGEGTGLQIKGVEALASGRAIIARKGAMRGLPTERKGWLEVESPAEMHDAMCRLYRDETARKKLSQKAQEYYMDFLNKDVILRNLKNEYQRIVD